MACATVLSLFSGIGGLDIGFGGDVVVHQKSISDESWIKSRHDIDGFVVLQKTKFKVVFQNDIEARSRHIQILNGVNGETFVTKSIADLLKDGYEFPLCDVVIGGFPCQDFSHAGKRRGLLSHVSDIGKRCENVPDTNRGTLYKSMVRVIEKTRPKIFVAENVYGLLTLKSNPLQKIVQDFTDIGYEVNYQVIKCEERGIPQKRWRLIIIGLNTSLLRTRVEEQTMVLNENMIQTPVSWYFKHLLEPEEDIHDVSQQSYSKAKLLTKGQGQTEIDIDGVAPTIRAEHHGNIEFRRLKDDDNGRQRRLTVRECGLIQTFSPTFRFSEHVSQSPYKFIGNAVPPLLSYLIARKVQYLLDHHF